jgi:hypothetical protein
MAEEILFSAEVELLRGDAAPNGDGYYYRLEGAETWLGPEPDEQSAVAKVMELLNASAEQFVKQAFNLE